jgi:hypothetical protein
MLMLKLRKISTGIDIKDEMMQKGVGRLVEHGAAQEQGVTAGV